MAAAPPKTTTGAHGSREPTIKHLVVDSSPLLTAPLSSLRGMAQQYHVTPDVVAELRDKRGRNLLEEAQIQLQPETIDGAQDDDAQSAAKAGLNVRQPTAEAIAKITAFARRTGDIAALSLADIRVLALCLTFELEENGSWRIRDYPGQVLTGPPPKEIDSKQADSAADTTANEDLAKDARALSINDKQDTPPVASTSAAEIDQPSQSGTNDASNATSPENLSGDTDAPTADAEDGNVSDADSDSSGGSWITPDNVTKHKIKDMGLFSAPDVANPAKPKTLLKSAVLTGDFAMQNVGLQMGLNVFGSGGKRVREVRTWVLRCHACFKLCKDPEKRFCPSCGGPTLIRTSITYVPATPENPQGYILHLKKNFQYRLRGSVYSLPTPKVGKAGGGKPAQPVLREDQKEWVKGVRAAENRKMKEERALLRSVMEENKKKGGSSTSTPDGLIGFTDLDWQPAMLLGEKGRRRGGKNGMGGDVPLDKSGMPLIGTGRRNPNEARKKTK